MAQVAASAGLCVEAAAAASAEEVFATKVSDHLPQVFRIFLPGQDARVVEVLSWNVMARALNRVPAGQQAGPRASNNGLDLDESIAAYEQRLLDRIARRLTAWIWARSTCHWLVCLQEAPSHPGQLSDLLTAVAAGCGLPAQTLRHAILRESASACNITLWDSTSWDLSASGSPAFAHAGGILCTVLTIPRGTGVYADCSTLRVWNCHLPSPLAGDGDADGHMIARQSQSQPKVLHTLLASVPTKELGIIVGDINADIRCNASELELAGCIAACVPDSTLYRGRYVTSNAIVAVLGGQSGIQPVSEEPHDLHPVAGGPILREGIVGSILGGLDREQFVGQNINYVLQGRVRRLGASGLSDEDLHRLGSYHFGDQEEVLRRWLAEGRAKESGPMNPFGGDGGRRDAFVKKHIHVKLNASLSKLTDQQVWSLGQLKFSEQPAELKRLPRLGPGGLGASSAICQVANDGKKEESNEAAVWRLMSGGGCGGRSVPVAAPCSKQTEDDAVWRLLGCSREEFIRTHIDFKLQEQVVRLGNAALHTLGQASYAEQAALLQRLRKDRQHNHRGQGLPSTSPNDCETSEAVVDDWDVAPVAPCLAPGVGWGADAEDATEVSGVSRHEKEGVSQGVHGLATFLSELQLSSYLVAAQEWCHEMGAISLEEVRENAEDFASSLALQPLDKRCLLRAWGIQDG